ncbi:hypothetical protein C1H46_001660 [Malus baccata]|uniref:Uncharacterized protein n=1 Tax=Malus baccata TaxID=106549 RepID=A0A540NP25_MALBA|nr:hypothetical protein C1H46_001660 [Malus baccata]
MIQLDDECEVTAREVKRKAIVGRPHNRYKDPLERRGKPQKKATKSSTRKGTRLKGSCIENGTQVPFFGSFTKCRNSIPLIQQIQEVMMHHHDLSQSNSADKGPGK